MSTRQKVAFYLEDVSTTPGKVIQVALTIFNLSACVLFVWGTTIHSPSAVVWYHRLDWFLALVFSVEYVLRLWSARRAISYVFSLYGLVDLLSILPTFLPVQGMSFLRALRVLRILKFTRYLENEEFFFGTISPLTLQITRTLFTVITIIFVAAGFIYYVEGNAPGTKIQTYDDALYFSVITVSTVGFGDVTPVTKLGRWITLLIVFSGLFFIPWQAGKLVRLLVQMEKNRSNRLVCPNCGLDDHEADALYCRVCGTRLVREAND